MTSLQNYAWKIKHQSEGFVNEAGKKQWTIVYSVPNDKVKAAYESFRPALSHKLYDTGSDYDPCVHRVIDTPDPESAADRLVIVTFTKPTRQMVLRPGRGFLTLDGAYNLVKRTTTEYPVFNEMITTGSLGVMSLHGIERKTTTQTATVSVWTFHGCAHASEEQTWLLRLGGWGGSYGSFSYHGTTLNNMKCSGAYANRRESDISLLDVQIKFAQSPWGWNLQDWDTTVVHYYDTSGAEVDEQPALGHKLRLKTWVDYSETASGGATTFDLSSFFTWETNLEKAADVQGTTLGYEV